MKARRSRTIRAPQKAVWRVISDPYHLPRWWPKVGRVEGVQERRRGTGTLWTKVLMTSAGRSVRADYRCLYSREPSEFAWEQEVEGSPFAKVFKSAVTRIALRETDGGTLVSLEAEQRLRGLSRFGGFMVKRATAAQLEQALDGLENAVADESGEGANASA